MLVYWKVWGAIGVCLMANGAMIQDVMAQARVAQPPTASIVLAQANANRKTEADRLYHQGVEQVNQEKQQDALQSLQASLKIYQEMGDRLGQLNSIRYMGWAYHDLKQYPQAQEQFQQSLQIAQSLNDRLGIAKALNGLGSVEEVLKSREQAITRYEQARAIAIELNDRQIESIILDNMITTYRNAGNWQKEIDFLTVIIPIYRELQQPKNEANRLASLGVAYSKFKQPQKSLESHQRSLTLYQQLNDRSGAANTLRNMGLSYEDLKDDSKAIEAFNQSLNIYRELKNDLQVARLLTNLGWLYKRQKNFVQAETSFSQSLELYSKLDNQTGMVAQLWQNLSWVYEDQKDWKRAIQAAEKSLALQRELKDSDAVTRILLSLGIFHQRQKDYGKAISYYEAHLAAMRQKPSFTAEAPLLRLLGDVYRSQNSSKENAEKAIQYYQDSITVAERQANAADVNHALQALGVIHIDGESPVYRPRRAREYFQKALSGWRSLKDQDMEMRALYFLGRTYVGMDNLNGTKFQCDDGFESVLEEGLAFFQKVNNLSFEAGTLNTLGRCYQDIQQHQKAIPHLERSLSLAKQVKDSTVEALSLVDLGRSYRGLGQLQKAKQNVESGIKILRESKVHNWEAYALDEITKIQIALGEDSQAIAAQNRRISLYFNHNIKLSDPGFNAVMVNIEQAKKFDPATYRDREEAKLRQKLEKHGLSIDLLKLLGPKVTDIKQGDFFAPSKLYRAIRESFTVLADAYVESGKHAQALELYRSTLSDDLDQGYSVAMYDIQILAKMGIVAEKMGQLAEAEAFFRRSLKYGEYFRIQIGYNPSTQKLWNDSSRIALAERKSDNFKRLQQLLIRQNRVNEALEVAEEARSRTFVELLSSRITGRSLGDDLPPAPNVETMRQIAKTQNATLVQYSIVEDNLLYIWVIKPTGDIQFRSTPLNANQPLQTLVTEGRRDIGVRGRASLKPIPIEGESASRDQGYFRELHQLLIEPIAQDLPKDPNQSVIFLPQGELFLVPFAALPNAQGQPLIEQHTLSIAPSIQTLEFTQALAKRPKSQGNVLIVGDPIMPNFQGKPLSPLPGARQEALAIGQLLNSTPILGEQATKSAVLSQMPAAKILHFATHGLLDDVGGEMPGAIALAPSGNDNGLLSSSEIFNLKLNADLVVLSACDTGRGKITGDGVIGLSRSFVAAGAPTVLVSLWAVNDNTTSELMIEFYRQLQTQPNKAQALRQAMLKTRSLHPDPLHWASFSLMGETK